MLMGDQKNVVQAGALKQDDVGDTRHVQWVFLQANSDSCESSSIGSGSTISNESTSSSDMVDDASSSPTSSLSFGPLFELSDLMSQLPIKRGLSKCYQGKSQSFASLASVKSLEDLAKKENPYRKRMKSCKSYGGGLDGHIFSPKATITKKNSSSRGSFLSSLGKRSVYVGSSRPSITVLKN